MKSIFKRNKTVSKLLKDNNFTTKINLYFSYNSVGEDYDEYEKNYTKTLLNKETIKAYVTDLTPEALVWKQYGTSEQGAKEVLVDSKYINWFKTASKIEIEDDEYSVYNQALGNKAIITNRRLNYSRIVLFKK